ncbi:MAG: tetratricopeptide repeat protein, partial [Chloroflexia bacterium]
MQPGNEHPIFLNRRQPVSDMPGRAPLSPSNLPTPPNLFIGRVSLVEEICNLISVESVRLLTLTGPGGVGKTRVAIQSAERLLPMFEDGAWFVPLASITNPDLVLSAIAGALGLTEEGSTTLLHILKWYLQDKGLLLVLDNFEQVVAAGPQIIDLLSNAPGVQVIVTSRMPLRVYGEHEYHVPLMDLPDELPEKQAKLKWLANYDAVRLFVARAREVESGFALTSGNSAYIVEICRRLDCLPLALELAAARLRLFSPQALLSRLDKALPLLTGGARDLSARQQTMRDAIGWSYNLLDPVEQKLFALMPVFVGGCTLDAIQAVVGQGTGDQGHGIEGIGVPTPASSSSVTVVDSLESLIAQNLLRRRDQTDGEPRFWMLATIREYAWERLAESGEERAARDAHAAFFLVMAEQFDNDLRGPKQGEWLDRLEREHDNLRAATQWYLESGQGEQAARMGAWLWWFWQARGYVSEGRQWLKRVLAAASTDASDQPGPFRSILAAVYNGAGALAGSQSDYAAATDFQAKSLKITREMGDKRGVARTLNNMGIFLSHQGAYAEAELCFKESFDLKQEIGDRIGLSSAYNRLAEIAHLRANYDQAISYFSTSLALRRERGDTIWIADTLQNIADLYFDLRQIAYCAELANESLALAQEAGYKEGQASASIRLGAVLCEQGEYDKATVYFESSLEIARSIGDTVGIARALKGLGQVFTARQDYDKASVFFQDALRTQMEAREYNAEMAGT